MPEKKETKIVKVKLKKDQGKRLGIKRKGVSWSIVQGEIKDLPFDLYLAYSGRLAIAKVTSKKTIKPKQPIANKTEERST